MARTTDHVGHSKTVAWLDQREAQRQHHRRHIETLLARSDIRPDLAELRHIVCRVLREFTLKYDGLPSTLRALACEKLVLTEKDLLDAMNAPEVLTVELEMTGRYSAPTAYVFRALYTRPEGLSRSDLLTLCRPAIGGTADLDVALLPLVQTRIVRATRREGKTRRGVRWYQVVRV